MSVSPNTLALELTLLTPTINVVFPAALTLELELLKPLIGVPFPTLSTSPKIEGFVDEYSDETINRDSYASGYPLINPQFDFDPKNFSHIIQLVSQADKETLSTFYRDNKTNNILWVNEQDDDTYLVIFTHKPYCELDGEKSKWKIELGFRQIAEV